MNQVWNGNTGSLTAKAMKNSQAIKVASATGSVASCSVTISKVRVGALKYRIKIASSSRALPARSTARNFQAARSRPGPPKRAINRNIGTLCSCQKRKKSR